MTPPHVTPPRGVPSGGRVPAERAAGGYRRAWAAERLRDSFWPVPALLLVAGVALAAVTPHVAFLVLEGGRDAADSSGPAVAIALVTASLIVFLGYVAAPIRLAARHDCVLGLD